MTGHHAWVTVVCSDRESGDALNLARGLRNVGTRYSLVAMVHKDVSPTCRERLEGAFDEVHVLSETGSSGRDRTRTSAKIQCWKLLRFSKCVFIDSGTIVLRNCDELFEREELSATPSNVWPDYFNTSVFVYRPSWQTFEDLQRLMQDESLVDNLDNDMVLLNTYFSDWGTSDLSKRLSFLYNLTPSNCYTYSSAYKKFGPGVKMVAHRNASNQTGPASGLRNDQHVNVWRAASKEFSKSPEECVDTLAVLPNSSHFVHYPAVHSSESSLGDKRKFDDVKPSRVNLFSEIPLSDCSDGPHTGWDPFFSGTVEEKTCPYQDVLTEDFSDLSDPQSAPVLVKSHYLYGMGNQYSFEDVQNCINRVLNDNTAVRGGKRVPIHINVVSRSSVKPFEVSETSYDYWSNLTKDSLSKTLDTKTDERSRSALDTNDVRYYDSLQHRFRKYNPVKEKPSRSGDSFHSRSGGTSTALPEKPSDYAKRKNLFKRLNDTLVEIKLTPCDLEGCTFLLKHANQCLKKLSDEIQPPIFNDSQVYTKYRAHRLVEEYNKLRDKMNNVGEVLDQFFKTLEGSHATEGSTEGTKVAFDHKESLGNEELLDVAPEKPKAMDNIRKAATGLEITSLDSELDILTRFDPLMTLDSVGLEEGGPLKVDKKEFLDSGSKSGDITQPRYCGEYVNSFEGDEALQRSLESGGTTDGRSDNNLIDFNSRVVPAALKFNPVRTPSRFRVRCFSDDPGKFNNVGTPEVSAGGFQDILLKIQETMRRK